MLDATDIKKLKTIFATKKDLERFATKGDLKRFATKEDLKRFATRDDLKKFVTKDDLKQELTKYATLEGQQDIISGINTIIEMLGGENIKNKEQDEILNHHEQQLNKLESKVFSTN